MDFSDKYVNATEAADPKNKDKKVISNDAFALGDVIQGLINKIEHLRAALK